MRFCLIHVSKLPGYGKSTPSRVAQDKRSTGQVILDALKWTLGSGAHGGQQQKIVIVGHDRGARICHRLAVDAPDYRADFDIVATILLDIVPTVVQWESFADSKAAAGSFHWPFLANVDLATSMISAMGGPAWCSAGCERWVGESTTGQKSFRSNNAVEIYSSYFASHEVVKASCEDYRAGAEEDVRLQKRDQAQGKKIEIPTLVLYSKSYLGTRYDITEVWKEWVGLKGSLKTEGFGGGVGHFFAEEAPERTAEAIMGFIDSLDKHGSADVQVK
ncbi:MAG: hypothetical protein LQ347_001350 [Umbilicaria vellea]|nr:MAG: hypothetical protein LQ347_001350 [Umbilicaria vellea]